MQVRMGEIAEKDITEKISKINDIGGTCSELNANNTSTGVGSSAILIMEGNSYLDSDSDSIDRSDEVSECTNPYLEHLLNRYFPSDDEDFGCQADVENDNLEFTLNSMACTRKNKRISPLRNKNNHRRFKDSGGRSLRKRNNKSGSVQVCNSPTYITDSDPSDHLLRTYGTEEGNDISHIEQSRAFNSEQWLDEARLQYVVGEVRRLKQHQGNKSNANPWDSSPSTIHVSSDESDKEIDLHVESSNTEPLIPKLRNTITDLDKSLFTPSREERMIGVTSLTDHCYIKDDLETENDFDLELTLRARQIQHDLRLQEFRELAFEAERAAEEGKERFVGNATKFGIEDSRDMALNSHRRSLPTCGKLTPDDKTKDYCQQLNSARKLSAASHSVSPSQFQGIPRTELKTPKPTLISKRLSSAPSKLQNRNSTPSSVANVQGTVSSTLLTATSFLSLSQHTFNDQKVPVLSLRHIEEVIPSFGEMHSFVRAHMVRNGVKENMLTLNPNDDLERKSYYEGKKSVTGSRSSSNSLFPRIPSFQKLFHSLSGLSVEDSSQQKPKSTLDPDLEFAITERKNDMCTVSINGVCKLVDLGSATFEESSEQFDDDGKRALQETDSKSDKFIKNDDGSDHNSNIVMSKSEQSEMYVCTLASEINTPGRRPRSPPLTPPYHDIDEKIKDIIRPNILPPTGSPPKSRWTTFWANISPSKTILKPVPKRSVSLPISVSLNHPGNTIEKNYQQGYQLPTGLGNDTTNDQNEFDRAEDHKLLPEFECILDSNIKVQTPSSYNSSCEKESNESTFLQQSNKRKNEVPIIKEHSATSMLKMKEDDDPLFDDFIKTTYNPAHLGDSESATSPKPPLHPAGIRLTTALLHNAGLYPNEVNKDTHSRGSNANYNSGESTEVNSFENRVIQKDLHMKLDTKDEASIDREDLHQVRRTRKIKSKDHDMRMPSPLHLDTEEMNRKGSFSSIPSSFRVGEDTANVENQSVHGGSLREIVTSSSIQKPGDISSDPFSYNDDNKKNESMSVFMELIDNVKVPSVMDKLSPLLGKKRQQDTYKDDTTFIENYFYVGVESESEDKIEGTESLDTFAFGRKNRFCDRGSCFEVVGCVDFGTMAIGNTFNMMLSKRSSWDKESGPLLNEPHKYDNQPWLRKALSQCAGQRHHQQRRELVIIGEKKFRAPNLSIQKSGFFTRNGDNEEIETFKVGRRPSITSISSEVGQVRADNVKAIKDDISTGFPEGQCNCEDLDARNFKDKVKKHESLLTFSDDEYSDNF